MPVSKRTFLALTAVNQALATLSSLPDSEHVLDLREQCLALLRTAERWEHDPPSPEERDALMKQALALQVAVTRIHRSKPAAPSNDDG